MTFEARLDDSLLDDVRRVEAMTKRKPPSPPVEDDPKRSLKSRFNGMLIEDMTRDPVKREWLTKGVILARTLFFVIGEPGSGKSFLMIDWICNHANAVVNDKHSGLWFGRKIKPCGIVYIAGEGQEDFEVRLHAWMLRKGLDPGTPMPIWVIPRPINLRDRDETDALIQEVQMVDRFFYDAYSCHVGIIVVDTLNKALRGGDVSRPEHVGAYMMNIATVRDGTGAAVVTIAHTIKNAAAQGRMDAKGDGQIEGDNDGQIFVKKARDGAPNDWRITRNKAGPEGDRHEFRMRQQIVGRDEEGEAITSCIIIPGAAELSSQVAEMDDAGKQLLSADGRAVLNDSLTLYLRALARAIENYGMDVPPPKVEVRVPSGKRFVSNKEWIAEIMRSSTTDRSDPDKFRDAIYAGRKRAADALLRRGIIGTDNDYYWRTDRKVAGVDSRPVVVSDNDNEESDQDLPLSDEAREMSGLGG